MTRVKRLRIAALVAVLALALAACGDGNGEVLDEETPPPDDTATETAPDEGAEADDQLDLGYILPETGQLAFLGPPQIRSVEMAVQEANDAGGVLGQDVTLSSGDEAGDAAVASESADRLLAEGVDAIVGAAASGMSLAVIDQITGAGVVQCSASNTSPTFTDYEDDGFYFRTAPSDVLQGAVLSELVLEDGATDIAMLARADDYGRGLLEAARDGLEEAGANVVYFETYDPEAATFDAEASEIAATDPAAVVLVPFEEGAQVLQAFIEQGIDPAIVYGADGIRSEELNDTVDPDDPNVLDGFSGTAPDPQAVPGFLDRLNEFAPDLEETIFAAQAYDCATLVILAAEAGGSADPADIADNMLAVTEGDNDCANVEECLGFLQDGESVAYQFASGTEAMSDVGEPVNGTYEVWEWQDAELVSVDSRPISAE